LTVTARIQWPHAQLSSGNPASAASGEAEKGPCRSRRY
jgi:hypothetical protein